MRFGVERLIDDPSLRSALAGRRVALLGHPASVTHQLTHSLDALIGAGVPVAVALGPQHGMRGERQDNMVESEDYRDPQRGIPVFSLYGKTRRLTPEMLDSFDVILIDLQDIGTRIYTFITTMFWVMDDCAQAGKSVWILDRPNPAGRPIEGTFLRPGFESFVGAVRLPMRHGLTMAELASWHKVHARLDLDLRLVTMNDYDPTDRGLGWPADELSWVNPSPNAATPSMPRIFPGTVLIEGTELSEGRGTTRPLELVGAPGLDIPRILERMAALAPTWMEGALIRPCWFEPTFNKHHRQLCAGFQVHVDFPSYAHERFHPVRLIALFLRAVRLVHPEQAIWRKFLYEYESDRLAIDLINGSALVREWVDAPDAAPGDLEAPMLRDESEWRAERAPHLLYPS